MLGIEELGWDVAAEVESEWMVLSLQTPTRWSSLHVIQHPILGSGFEWNATHDLMIRQRNQIFWRC